MPRTEEELLTGEQVAQNAKVTEPTIERWRREGVIPYLWLGHRTIRYRWSDVVAALEQLSNEPKAQEIRVEHSKRGRLRAKSMHAIVAARRAEERSSICTE
jgi:hypothetical protein